MAATAVGFVDIPPFRDSAFDLGDVHAARSCRAAIHEAAWRP